ncbi:acyl-CoA thioester hydrolase [Erysipelotrichaceae bacterium]|nr:acyl-CoA thioester hydrolase [Erysipelotrichaceae bacterium]
MFRVETEIEVRYAETDQMGVVYHANYLVWLEIGRTKFLEALGLNYGEMEKMGVLAPMVEANLKYKKPAKYGDVVTVKTGVKKTSAFKTVYVSEIRNQDGALCIIAVCTVVTVDAKTFKLKSIKKDFPEWYQKYSEIADE